MIVTFLLIALLQLASSNVVHSIIEYISKSPYHVSLRDSNGVHICGGAIIKPNIILTSGECDFSAKYVVAGSPLPTLHHKFSQTVKISKVERNIGAFGERFLNLYFLEKNLIYNDDVQQIAILRRDPHTGSSAKITGFTNMNGDQRLRSVDVEISNYGECKSLLNHPRYSSIVTCPFSETKAEICRALEQTSLLACNENGEKLCGIYFGTLNFNCYSDTATQNVRKLMTSFVKLSAFEWWLKQHNIL